MNTNELEMFLPAMLAGSIALTLFIIARNLILSTLKKRPSERAADIRTGDGNTDLRRKLPRNLNIICMLPMYEEKRPEQRLW